MEPVKDYQGMKIIGIDNGYGNIKTANCCFPAGPFMTQSRYSKTICWSMTDATT